ncbi:MAG: RNase adapter RapZ [Chloroflexi bacterium]|nr:RNase adapter RapZ [Chloroflexota bacterium]
MPNAQSLQFVVVTGLSGAGKTQALRALEDLGFYCVDNLPPALMETFADLCLHSQQRIERAGLVIDVRGGEFFGDLLGSLDVLKARGIRYRLVYLDADDETLLRRFEETRRRHPVPSDGGLSESIRDEREMLREVRSRAHLIVDTTTLPPHQLKRKLAAALSDIVPSENLQVQVVSFGFKHGLPTECDLVFDIRFLPNPHHEPSLRHLSGLDQEVREYVGESAAGQEFLTRLKDFLGYCLPQYAQEGKAYLTIGIGCTGGRHRSVMVGEAVAAWARDLGYPVTVRHRDLERETSRPTSSPADSPPERAAPLKSASGGSASAKSESAKSGSAKSAAGGSSRGGGGASRK